MEAFWFWFIHPIADFFGQLFAIVSLIAIGAIVSIIGLIIYMIYIWFKRIGA